MWLARRHCAVQIAVSSVCGWRLDGGGTSDSGSSSEATLYLSGGVLGLLPRHAKSGGLPTLTSPPLFGLARSGAGGRALSRPAPPEGWPNRTRRKPRMCPVREFALSDNERSDNREDSTDDRADD